MSDLGKISITGAAKKRIAKAISSGRRKNAKATSRILKSVKKSAGHIIDVAAKRLNALKSTKTRTKKKATKRRTSKRRK